jgi:hypothetical protein
MLVESLPYGQIWRSPAARGSVRRHRKKQLPEPRADDYRAMSHLRHSIVSRAQHLRLDYEATPRDLIPEKQELRGPDELRNILHHEHGGTGLF